LKLLQENIEKTFEDIGISRDFLIRTPVRATLDQWDSITPKEQTIQSMNAQMN
jgi:hypothetical protein